MAGRKERKPCLQKVRQIDGETGEKAGARRVQGGSGSKSYRGSSSQRTQTPVETVGRSDACVLHMVRRPHEQGDTEEREEPCRKVPRGADIEGGSGELEKNDEGQASSQERAV